jgi:hypothetical protein
MPLLHIQIKNHKQLVEIHQDIKAQRMILRSATIEYGKPASKRLDGVRVDISEMLGVGREIAASSAIRDTTGSNALSHQNLYFARPGLVNTTASSQPYFYITKFDMSFHMFHLKQAFHVTTYSDGAAGGAATFGDDAVREINLYFEYGHHDVNSA